MEMTHGTRQHADAQPQRRYVPIWLSHFQAIKQLPKEERGNIMLAIADYGFDGVLPELTGGAAMLWTAILPVLERNRALSMGGSRGGRASKRNNPSGRRGKAKGADSAEAPTASSPDTPQTPPPPPHPTADPKRPPTADEVRSYAVQRGYGIDADMFVSYYQARGWTLGGRPVSDWRSLADVWHLRQPQQGEQAADTQARRETLGRIQQEERAQAEERADTRRMDSRAALQAYLQSKGLPPDANALDAL